MALWFCACALGGEALPLQDALARAKAEEAKQVEVIQRIAPAVCAIFPKAVGAGGGSGVLIHPAGYALTNYHVTRTQARLNVGLPDGKIYKAKLLGIDPTGDIALVRLEGRDDFPFVALGDSDAVRVGDRTLAMGNPFLLATDFKPTVTQGIVSGVHRYRGGGRVLCYGDSIQTDTSINPGNSGGPLFNLDGELIGINGLIGIRPTRGRINVGVGFAVAVNQIKNFLPDLRACKVVEHGTLDVTVDDRPNPDKPEELLVTVDQIDRDGVAAKLGVDLRDVVVRFDGKPVTSANRYLTLITGLPAGRRVDVVFKRRIAKGEWKTFQIRATLAGLPVPTKIKDKFSGTDPDHLLQETEAILAGYLRFLGGPEAAEQLDRLAFEGVRFRVDEEGKPLRAGKVKGSVDGIRIRIDLDRGGGDTESLTSNGKVGWVQRGEAEPEAMADSTVREITATLRLLQVIRSPDPLVEIPAMRFDGGGVVGGRPVDRVVVSDEKTGKRVLYFDCESRALLRMDLKSAVLNREVEVVFGGYRTLSGTKVPARIDVAGNDGTLLFFDQWKGIHLGVGSAVPVSAGKVQGAVQKALPGIVTVYGAGGIIGIPGYATGILLTPDGYILTADSVMLETPDLKVVLPDGRRFPAKLCVRNRALASAILKVEMEGLTPLAWGNPDAVVPGDFVIAIGNSFNIAVGEEKISSSLGIVVAKGRLALRIGVSDFPYQGPVIITDAAVNPGTQGGPLIDLAGNVLGMCGKVVESKTTNTQINYAIPVTALKAFIEAGIRGKAAPGDPVGTAPKAAEGEGRTFGIIFFDVFLARSPPAYVHDVLNPSPARDAGLQRDDLIIKVGEKTVHSVEECRKALALLPPGETADLSIKRKEKILKVQLAVPAKPEKEK
jgi:S1-C subfamily serine protease